MVSLAYLSSAAGAKSSVTIAGSPGNRGMMVVSLELT